MAGAWPNGVHAVPADTDYFGRPEQAWMLNFRVRDLDAMVAQLRAAGVRIDSQETEEGAGRFAWLVDPEGNRIELWEPTPEVLEPADPPPAGRRDWTASYDSGSTGPSRSAS